MGEVQEEVITKTEGQMEEVESSHDVEKYRKQSADNGLGYS